LSEIIPGGTNELVIALVTIETIIPGAASQRIFA
jgi:hypothetical protein